MRGDIIPKLARYTDIHEGICSHGLPCCPHNVVGIIIKGSNDTNANSLKVARLGDEVEHNCPHCGIGRVDSSSSTVIVNGIGVARLGDKVIYPGGEGKIVEASPDVYTGD